MRGPRQRHARRGPEEQLLRRRADPRPLGNRRPRRRGRPAAPRTFTVPVAQRTRGTLHTYDMDRRRWRGPASACADWRTSWSKRRDVLVDGFCVCLDLEGRSVASSTPLHHDDGWGASLDLWSLLLVPSLPRSACPPSIAGTTRRRWAPFPTSASGPARRDRRAGRADRAARLRWQARSIRRPGTSAWCRRAGLGPRHPGADE